MMYIPRMSAIKLIFILWLCIANFEFCHCQVDMVDSCAQTHQQDNSTDTNDVSDCHCAVCNVVIQSNDLVTTSTLATIEGDQLFGEPPRRLYTLPLEVILQPPI